MFFIQRRTVADTLAGAGGFAGVEASAAQAVSRSTQNFSLPEQWDTLTVCQIHLPTARFSVAAPPCRPGGFRGVARLMSRLTELSRCAGS